MRNRQYKTTKKCQTHMTEDIMTSMEELGELVQWVNKVLETVLPQAHILETGL